MLGIKAFIEKMKEKYGDEVVVKERVAQTDDLDKIPLPLREFYTLYESAQFPFGEIDDTKTAIKHSEMAEPFKSEGWFCFGSDGYFSFWLCRYVPDEEGLWIVDWDHDIQDEIECVYAQLVDFLEDMEKRYTESDI